MINSSYTGIQNNRINFRGLNPLSRAEAAREIITNAVPLKAVWPSASVLKAQTVINPRKFIDKTGKEIFGVSIKKGIVRNQDNSMFTGIMQTINKKGQNIQLTYECGFLRESKIDGKLFKRYYRDFPDNNKISCIVKYNGNHQEITTYNYDKTTGKKIFSKISIFDDDGNIVREERHCFHENGRISEIEKVEGELDNWENPNHSFVTKYSSEGKLLEEYEALSNGEIINLKKYDINEKLIEERATIEKPNSNIKKSFIRKPIYDKDGNFIKYKYENYRIRDERKKTYVSYDWPEEIAGTPFTMLRYTNGNEHYEIFGGSSGYTITANFDNAEYKLRFDFANNKIMPNGKITKKQIDKIIDMLKEGIQMAKENELNLESTSVAKAIRKLYEYINFYA